MMSTFEDGVKVTPFSPAKLWATVKNYSIRNSESVKLMLRSESTSFKKSSGTAFLENMEEFHTKVDAYLGANGKMDKEGQAHQLVTSLNHN